MSDQFETIQSALDFLEGRAEGWAGVKEQVGAAEDALAELEERFKQGRAGERELQAEVVQLREQLREALPWKQRCLDAEDEIEFEIGRKKKAEVRADTAERELDQLRQHYAPFVSIVATLAIYGEAANIASLVEKARDLNDA